jgi:hypothetical protein
MRDLRSVFIIDVDIGWVNSLIGSAWADQLVTRRTSVAAIRRHSHRRMRGGERLELLEVMLQRVMDELG